ncbi:FANCI solenoid 1-domain-containing protein [Pilaira anomala]|nr:FANCI solenoid 1-domain-containing protein [Pilaira anomala]
MDVEIFKLNKQSDKSLLIKCLNETSNEEIARLLKEKLDDYYGTNDVDTILLLRAMFQDKEKLEKSKQASHVVNLILPEIELLASDMLREIGITITEIIDENSPVQLRILDIFSKVWNVLAAADELNHLSDIFDHLLEARWNNQVAVGISSASNEIELSNSQLETIIRHMIRKLSDLEMEEVPPFIYQLLLLSRKDSCMEGTVMLHISFAIKQDKDLGDELVKLIKNDKSSQLEVFNIACLLSAARIHRLQDTIFDLFKTSILSIYKDKEKLDRSIWISEYSPLDAEKYSQVLLDVVEKSALGWDQVIQSLTQLALILIDNYANNDSIQKTRSSNLMNSGANEQVANLGVSMLSQLFKHHDVVRSEILEQITSRIVSRSDSAMEFLSLLQHIIQKYPEEVEKYLSNVIKIKNNNMNILLTIVYRLRTP